MKEYLVDYYKEGIKKCRVCKKLKDKSKYSINLKSNDGYFGFCIECQKWKINNRKEDKIELLKKAEEEVSELRRLIDDSSYYKKIKLSNKIWKKMNIIRELKIWLSSQDSRISRLEEISDNKSFPDDEIGTKLCRFCGEVKDKSKFQPSQISSDGHHFLCMECQYEDLWSKRELEQIDHDERLIRYNEIERLVNESNDREEIICLNRKKQNKRKHLNRNLKNIKILDTKIKRLQELMNYDIGYNPTKIS